MIIKSQLILFDPLKKYPKCMLPDNKKSKTKGNKC